MLSNVPSIFCPILVRLFKVGLQHSGLVVCEEQLALQDKEPWAPELILASEYCQSMCSICQWPTFKGKFGTMLNYCSQSTAHLKILIYFNLWCVRASYLLKEDIMPTATIQYLMGFKCATHVSLLHKYGSHRIKQCCFRYLASMTYFVLLRNTWNVWLVRSRSLPAASYKLETQNPSYQKTNILS